MYYIVIFWKLGVYNIAKYAEGNQVIGDESFCLKFMEESNDNLDYRLCKVER